ncbi:hypothetical protein BPOR_0236g00110 [Botrytis porri]|uniref:Uncharacterized protein n=1 Tax=Botrytis porri TaxID=87229 RepID=A0A4Z1KP98_9HELO|nr:hypothetical protein BPOR_0236g00110 [Botrytis porri]
MYLPLLTLTLTFLLTLTTAIAVPAPNPHSALEAKDFIPDKVSRQVLPRQGIPFPEPEEDIEPPRDDGLVPFAGGGPVVGKWVKPTFTPGPEDDVLPFSNSVAFCPYPGTAYCCNPNPGTGGTLCKWNGDGHLAGWDGGVERTDYYGLGWEEGGKEGMGWKWWEERDGGEEGWLEEGGWWKRGEGWDWEA